MSMREALEAFSKNHISEGDETEYGYIANKILQYLENSMEREDINTFVEEEIEDYKNKIDDLEEDICDLQGEIYEKDQEIEELKEELQEALNSEEEK